MNKVDVTSAQKRFPVFGSRLYFALWCASFLIVCSPVYGQTKQPNVQGRFYPKDSNKLSQTVKGFLSKANPTEVTGRILLLIVPHAGYEFSGQTAAIGYKALESSQYDTVLVIGPKHNYNFPAAALLPKGFYRTPLGDITIDESLSQSLLAATPLFSSRPRAFDQEHSIEVQFPFLQMVFPELKIVPILMGSVDFSDCRKLAAAIAQVTKDKNCLIVVSSDMYHGYDYQEGELKDIYTLSLIRTLKPRELYDNIQANRAQLCGWAGVVTAMLVAQELGYRGTEVLDYTHSAKVMNSLKKGQYCVGYSSVAVFKNENQEQKGGAMLNENQRKKILKLARDTIEYYFKTAKQLTVTEDDPVLSEEWGAFVTLHNRGQLRGCIGNIVGRGPLYLTISNMAIAATQDERFRLDPVTEKEMPEIEIEISVLTPLEKIEDVKEIELGKHGVVVKNGYSSGVFLPQVATETGWSKEEFLSYLCSHKAGLDPLAWKDPSTEIYIFSAEVFSE